jgi:two-component system response regulator PilR (NtrC family)
VAISRDEWIDADALPPALTEPPRPSAGERMGGEGVKLEELLEEFERGLLLEALERAGGVKKRAAHLLGVSFRSLRYRLEKLGLDGPFRDDP